MASETTTGECELAIAFALIAGPELRANRTAWTLCLWRWRWPVLVTRGLTGGGYGWVRGVGWFFGSGQG